MTREQFEDLRAKQDLTDLFYPQAIDWMWDYCLNLGKFTDSKGVNYDLGVHFNGEELTTHQFSLAIVHSNNPGDYNSGDMNYNSHISEKKDSKTFLEQYKEWGFEHYIETWDRLQLLIK